MTQKRAKWLYVVGGACAVLMMLAALFNVIVEPSGTNAVIFLFFAGCTTMIAARLRTLPQNKQDWCGKRKPCGRLIAFARAHRGRRAHWKYRARHCPCVLPMRRAIAWRRRGSPPAF